MPDTLLTLHRDAVLVEVGGTTVAYVPSTRELLALTSSAEAVVDAVRAGDPTRLPDEAMAIAEHLLAVGVLDESDDAPA